jgi:phage repressor protein C with HTH and peptisase S24 domain
MGNRIYPSGTVKVISENAKHDSAELPQDQIRINGRVIWYGREI